jgi:hypothetical protein
LDVGAATGGTGVAAGATTGALVGGTGVGTGVAVGACVHAVSNASATIEIAAKRTNFIFLLLQRIQVFFLNLIICQAIKQTSIPISIIKNNRKNKGIATFDLCDSLTI